METSATINAQALENAAGAFPCSLLAASLQQPACRRQRERGLARVTRHQCCIEPHKTAPWTSARRQERERRVRWLLLKCTRLELSGVDRERRGGGGGSGPLPAAMALGGTGATESLGQCHPSRRLRDAGREGWGWGTTPRRSSTGQSRQAPIFSW
eukprot:361200-Chlamydomonas_euryale.AAC.19